MAEGEINIDNIIQRLLEGEMSTTEFNLFSSCTSWTSNRELFYPL